MSLNDFKKKLERNGIAALKTFDGDVLLSLSVPEETKLPERDGKEIGFGPAEVLIRHRFVRDCSALKYERTSLVEDAVFEFSGAGTSPEKNSAFVSFLIGARYDM